MVGKAFDTLTKALVRVAGAGNGEVGGGEAGDGGAEGVAGSHARVVVCY